ncbi:sensor domain-containing diguanylate cyclase [Cohnella soli]|uniref:Diguanylate cyclase n=1 Tax=Cohnella soli TaxID=425005 RepID=A0ABW0HQF0_9BACL
MSLPALEINQERWNRILLKSYWAVLLLSILVECSFLMVTKLSPGDFIGKFIVRPTIIMTVIVALAELGVRRLTRFHDYVMITAATLLTVSISAIHSSLQYLMFFLFFPVMISIFYFQSKKLLYAALSTVASLLLLHTFNSVIHSHVSYPGLLALLALLLVYCGVAFGILARGREILMRLRTSYESNQELLVRTIMMDKLAKTDALTDTYNHMAYHEYSDYLTVQADAGMPLFLAVMDIDNFKKVNDTYGHKAGDLVLRSVAEIVRTKVGSNDIVARYGGEEFVVLFAEKSFQEVYDIVEDIRHSIAAKSQEALLGSNVTVSIGLNDYETGMGKEALFHGADVALYDAKRTGKNKTSLSESLAMKAMQFN